MRSGCYGGDFKLNARFDAQPLSFLKTKWQKKAVTIPDLAAATTRLTCEEADVSKYGLGIVLFSTDAKGRGLVGNFETDTSRGAYHNYIGASCGLMRKLDFQREDQPYLREAKIQKEGALGAEQLRELYSVNITMVGNNLYRNGGYTYISPVLLNTPKEQLTLLGLHGYFMVTEVSSELTESSFTTQIRALQEGIEFSKGEESETPPQKAAEPSENPDKSKSPPPAEDEEEYTEDTGAGGDDDAAEVTGTGAAAVNPSTSPASGGGTTTNAAQRFNDRIAAERQSAYDRGENPYPSRKDGRRLYERQQAARNTADRARAEGGSITLQGYDANTDRQDDPDLAQQATTANEGN